MTMERTTRVDRVLPALFVELADARTPVYLEAAIEQASSRPQRPAWTFPGRWLPMEISTRVASAPRMPMRTIALLALVALLAAILALVVGQQRDDVPAPFGPAANGAIVHERDGDIVAVDPASGEVTTLVSGPERDSAPVYSPDGLKIGFERATDRASEQLLMVADADGTGVVQASAVPLDSLTDWRFSPDGRHLLVTSRIDAKMRISILAADGTSEPRVLDVRLPVDIGRIEPATYRPPDGSEILVVGLQDDGIARGIYLVDAESLTVRPMVEPVAPVDVLSPAWSPDGKWLSYVSFTAAAGITARTHVMRADGSGDRLLDAAPGTFYDAAWVGAWSNDSTRLIVTRGYDDEDSDEHIAVVGLDSSTPSVELDCAGVGLASCVGAWTWAPDDSVLLGAVGPDQRRHLLADPATGIVTDAPWDASGPPTWQRLAPTD